MWKRVIIASLLQAPTTTGLLKEWKECVHVARGRARFDRVHQGTEFYYLQQGRRQACPLIDTGIRRLRCSSTVHTIQLCTIVSCETK